jgi:hypothetical protein
MSAPVVANGPPSIDTSLMDSPPRGYVGEPLGFGDLRRGHFTGDNIAALDGFISVLFFESDLSVVRSREIEPHVRLPVVQRRPGKLSPLARQPPPVVG